MIKTDLLAHDPDRWGHSLGNATELLLPLLDAVEAKSIVEVGAYAGDLTGELVAWAKHSGAQIIAVDPGPHYDLMAMATRSLSLELVRERSHDALRHLPVPDVAIIDGDHNYYTVNGELRLIAEQAGDGPLPLFILHDVGWPHARRDTYFTPEEIPEEHRQPMVEGAHLVPEEPGTTERGLLFHWAAAREGGARNGVLTAVEDFVADHAGLELAIIPVFFGIGIVWSREAPWAQAVADLVAPWDRNPVLEWLEANRVYNLALRNVMVAEVGGLIERSEHLEQQLAEQAGRYEGLLRGLLDSRAFASADRLSSLRRAGRPADSWRAQIRQALGEDGGSDSA